MDILHVIVYLHVLWFNVELHVNIFQLCQFLSINQHHGELTCLVQGHTMAL